LAWSHYERKESQRNTRCSGDLEAYARYLDHLSQKLLPGGDKRLAPYLSSVTYGDGRSADANAEAIYIAWFDCDQAGDWHTLSAWAQRIGLAAIFQPSTSRKGWHVGFPLTAPIRFAQGSTEERERYKHEYKHMVAVLSALSGFPGVGGHCGLDLCTDRLVQPMFVPMRRSENELAAPVDLLRGTALDWNAILGVTGFDYSASIEADNKTRSKPKRRGARSSTPITMNPGDFGPLGKALLSAGMIGQQKDNAGYHAACTQPTKHSSGNPWGYAIYFPGSDTLWCPSRGCQTDRPSRADQVQALPQKARKVYWDELGVKLSTVTKNTIRTPEIQAQTKVPAIKAWVAHEVAAKEGADQGKVVKALINFMLKSAEILEEDVLLDVARLALSDTEALDQVARARKRLEAGKPMKGVGVLRTFGAFALLDLAAAINADVGVSRLTLTSKLTGWRFASKDEKRWLEGIADKLPDYEPALARVVRRPGFCGAFSNEVWGDGEKVYERCIYCESVGCLFCWQGRTEAEAFLTHEWWSGRGKPFYVHQIVFPDGDAVDEVENAVKRDLHFPRVKMYGRMPDGRPTLTWVTDNSNSDSNLSVVLGYAARMRGDLDYTEEKTDLISAQKKIHRVRMSLMAHQRKLIEKRDEEGLLEWVKWLRPMKDDGQRGYRHLVTNSRSEGSLPWPNRKHIREFMKRKNEEEIDLSECDFIQYALKHVNTNTEIARQEYPFQIDQAIRLGRRSKALQSVLTSLGRELSYEELAEREARLENPDAYVHQPLTAEQLQVWWDNRDPRLMPTRLEDMVLYPPRE
jgi:hypothetical protein